MELTETEKRLISNRIAKAKDEATIAWRSELERMKGKTAGTWSSGSQFSTVCVAPAIEASRRFLENCRNILLEVLAPHDADISDDQAKYITAELEERLQGECKWVTEWVRDSKRQGMRAAPSSDDVIKRRFDEIWSVLRRDIEIEQGRRAIMVRPDDPVMKKVQEGIEKAAEKMIEQFTGKSEVLVEKKKDIVPPVLNFIATKELIPILQRDYLEIVRCMDAGCWKAAIILCGSCIEGILYDLLKKNEAKALASKKAQTDRDNKTTLSLEKWDLYPLIEVSLDLKLIGKEIRNLHDSARDYRNLIHPAKEVTSDYKIDEPEAKNFLAVIDMLIRDLK